MTLSLTASTKVGLLACHVDGKVRLQIGAAHVDLDQEQQAQLADYLAPKEAGQ